MALMRSKRKCIAGSTSESLIDSNASRPASPRGSLQTQTVLPPCISTPPSVPSLSSDAVQTNLAVLPPCISASPSAPSPGRDAVSNVTNDAALRGEIAPPRSLIHTVLPPRISTPPSVPSPSSDAEQANTAVKKSAGKQTATALGIDNSQGSLTLSAGVEANETNANATALGISNSQGSLTLSAGVEANETNVNATALGISNSQGSLTLSAGVEANETNANATALGISNSQGSLTLSAGVEANETNANATALGISISQGSLTLSAGVEANETNANATALGISNSQGSLTLSAGVEANETNANATALGISNSQGSLTLSAGVEANKINANGIVLGINNSQRSLALCGGVQANKTDGSTIALRIDNPQGSLTPCTGVQASTDVIEKLDLFQEKLYETNSYETMKYLNDPNSILGEIKKDKTEQTKSNEVYNTQFDYTWSVQGNFHQGNEIFGTNVGKQCTVICFVALTYSELKSVKEWISDDMDKVLFEGDKLYTILQRSSTIRHDYLDVHELPEQLDIFNIEFSYEYSDTIPVVLNGTNDDLIQFNSYTLTEALQITFTDYMNCFITFADYTISVRKHDNAYYLFDSHARDRRGWMDANGKSVLINLNSIEGILAHCHCLLDSMKLNQVIPCEVTGVNISNGSNEQISLTLEHNETADVSLVCEMNRKNFDYFPVDSATQEKLCHLMEIPLQQRLNLKYAENIHSNFTTKSIRKDGNCFFRAISYAISGSECFYTKIRKLVVKYMTTRSDLFESFLRNQYNNISDYLMRTSMHKNRTWATELEILVTSLLLNTNIYTFTGSSWLKHSPDQVIKTVQPNKCSIYLKHCNSNHYEVVIGATSVHEDEKSIQYSGNYPSTSLLNNAKDKGKCVIDEHSEATPILLNCDWTERKFSKKKKRLVYSKKVKRLKKCAKTIGDINASSDSVGKDEKTFSSRYRRMYETNENFRKKHRLENKQRYWENEAYRKEVITHGKQKYRRNKCYRDKLIKTGKLKYAENEEYKAKLKQQSKQRYRQNEEYKHSIVKQVKQKYRQNEEYRHSIIKQGKQKYRQNEEYRHSIIEQGKQKYRQNEEYRHKLIQQSKQRYRQNEEYKHSIVKQVKQRYRQNEEYRHSIIKQGKQKYRQNAEYRHSIIKQGKQKYRQNEEYRHRIIEQGKQKYRQNEWYRKQLKKASVSKYFLNSKHREKVKQSSVRKYRTNTVHRKKVKRASKKNYANEQAHKKNLSEANRKKKSKGNKSMQNVINLFKKEIHRGPEFICSCCHRLLFENQVLHCNENKYVELRKDVSRVAKQCISKKYLHDCIDTCEIDCVIKSSPKGKLWICYTCHKKLLNGCIPAESEQNNLKLESIPESLACLNNLEQHLVSLHIPFMKILALPKGGQQGVHGPVVCVPSDIKKTTNILPRSDGNNMLLPVKLKRKLCYKGYYQYKFVDQKKIEDALIYLKQNNKWYTDVTIDEHWLSPIPEHSDEYEQSRQNSSDTCQPVINNDESVNLNNELIENEFEERLNGFQHDSCLQPDDIGQHVLDHYCDEILNLAPAEGNNPIKILKETGNEAKTFPIQFPSGKFTYNDEREEKLTLSRYFNMRLMNADQRFASDTDYIFYSQYMSEFEHVISSVSIACRKSNRKTVDGTEITAEMLKDSNNLKTLINSDQIYKFLTPVRGTPSYWQTAQKDLFAMLRQLGIPTWFCSFSSADTRWKELIRTMLTQQNDQRIPEALDWNNKCKLLSSNPVTPARMFDHRFHTFMKQVILLAAAPIGKIIDYFYRVEFQHRGSPHTHCLFWVENAPIFNQDSNEDVCNFINKYVTCAVPNKDEDPELFDIVTNVQQHSKTHSKSCRKKGTTCRYNFPRPPSNKTFITQTKTKETVDTANMSTEEAKEKIQSVWKVILESDSEYMSCDELFEKAGQSQNLVEEAFQVLAQRNDIVLKRKPKEIWTNQYNSDLLRCWDANMDIQFVLDAYACIVYVISYISKAEREMGLLLRQTKAEADEANLDAQKTMKKLGTTYLNYREVSAQESVYRVCNLRLKECSRKVQFVPVGENPVRMRMPLKYLSAENTDNIWMSSITDKYKARPSTIDFDKMPLATFCSEYRILAKSQVPKCMRKDNEHSESNDAKFSNTFRLQNDMGYIQKRSRTDPAIIRYPRFSETNSPELYYRSVLELFLPHRTNNQLKPPGYETYENFFHAGTVKLTPDSEIQSVKTLVESAKNIYDKNSTELENAEKMLQESAPVDAWARLCPETELDQDECRNKATATVNDGENELINDTDLQCAGSNYSEVPHREINPVLYTKNEIKPLLFSMNTKQAEVFYKVRKWCLEELHGKNPEPLHLFITGGAGVGKSLLIKCIYYEVTRLLSKVAPNPDDTIVLLTAPTGTAAFNIKGKTIHSALSIPLYLGKKYVGLLEEKLNTLRATLGNLKMIIIDEVSMINKMLLYYISERLGQIKKSREGCPFGNISVIAVGDLYQIPPIRTAPENLLYVKKGSDSVDLFNEYFSVAELDQVMRQQNDTEFANMLNRCRVKTKTEKITDNDLNMLKESFKNKIDDALHIYPRNNDVNEHNLHMAFKLGPVLRVVDAEDYVKNKTTGQIVTKKTSLSKKMNTNLETSLFVGEGARVMLIRNIDVSDGLVNGVIGTVVKVMPKQIFVVFDNENVGKNACREQENFSDIPVNAVCIQKVDEEINDQRGTIRKQFPLKLAWACTVHKVQGLTLQKVFVSLDKTFTSGMAYVALSRVTSQAGLQIQGTCDKTLHKMIYCDEKINKAVSSMPKFISNVQTMPSSHTTIILHNIEGLMSNLPCIKSDRRFLSADYLCLTETWLTRNRAEIEATELQNFIFFQTPRCSSYDQSNSYFDALKKQSHGGVCVYVKDCLEFQSENMSLPNLEYISFSIASIDLTAVVIYRPNSYPLALFLKTIQMLAEKMLTCGNCIIMGDFNQDVFVNSSIEQVLEKYGYKQLVREATTEGGTLLDHVYLKGTIKVDIDIIPTFFSYHEAISIRILGDI